MKSPFKFLDSYTKEDRDIFFGREREIEELYHRVFESKIMLVYGVSGTGKSSLIHCGLANKFQETDWLPLVIRRGGNMLDNLGLAIKAASITPLTGEILTPLHFKKAVKSLYLDHYKPVFFIFDQFEELFIFGNKDEKRSFIQVIKAIVESDIQCRFIFVMREEYMASFTEFERYIPSIFQNRVRIEKMSHTNALEAIKGPCKVAGINVEEGFAESLLEKLSPESADVELTYLQVFLDRIFRSAAGNYPPFRGDEGGLAGLNFTTSLLSQVGDVSDLLGSFLDEQISLLSDPDTGLAVLKSFVSVKGTKQPMKVEEVRDYVMTLGRNPDEKSLAEMIQSFVSLRILCDKDQHDRYELRHDALAAKIYEKFTLVEKELLEVRKFVENAFYSFETRGVFLNKEDLDYLKDYDNKLILPKALAEFVVKSKEKIELKKKTLIRITRLSALVFIIMVAAIFRQYKGKLETVKDKVQIGSFLLQSESDPAYGIEGIFELWTKNKNSTVLRHLMLSMFQKIVSADTISSDSASRMRTGFRPYKLPAKILNADISQKGDYIFGWLSNNSVFVLNPGSNKMSIFESLKQPLHIEISSIDSLLAIVYKDGSGIVTDLSGKLKYSFTTTPNYMMDERLVAFFHDNRFQLAVVKDKAIEIYDRKGELQMHLESHKKRINSIDISPDGRFIASASCDKKVLVWNFNSNLNKYSIYDSLIGHKDVVWSCQFNSRGNYILTASADSTERIWNLLGKEVNTAYMFTRNSENSPRSNSHNIGEPDEDLKNPLYGPYYRKMCNAKFSKDQYNIISTGYEITDSLKATDNLNYNQVLFYDNNSKFNTQYYTEYMDMEHTDEDIIMPRKFRRLVVSPSGNMAACEYQKELRIDLCATDGLRLLTVKGTNPMFSSEGKYIFWVDGSIINKMPLSPDIIMELLNQHKLLKPNELREKNLVGI
ncbi:MAG: AAA family ATPase [Bacteroidales bacterium]|jgi:energy-coupling factor transporter ATP-binding protein EcfA2